MPESISLTEFARETAFILNLTAKLGEQRGSEKDRSTVSRYARNGEAGGWVRFNRPAEALLKVISERMAKSQPKAASILSRLSSLNLEIDRMSGQRIKTQSEKNALEEMTAERDALELAQLRAIDTWSATDIRGIYAAANISLQRDIAPFVGWKPGTSETGTINWGAPEERSSVVGDLHSHPEDSSHYPSSPDLSANASWLNIHLRTYPNWIGRFVFHEGSGRMSWLVPSAHFMQRKEERETRSRLWQYTNAREALCRAWTFSASHEATTRPSREQEEISSAQCVAWAAEQTGHVFYETAQGEIGRFRRVRAPRSSVFALLSEPQVDPAPKTLTSEASKARVILMYFAYLEDLFRPGEGAGNTTRPRTYEILSTLWRRYVIDTGVPGEFSSPQLQQLLLHVVDAQADWNENTPATLTFCPREFRESQSGSCMRMQSLTWRGADIRGPHLSFVLGTFNMERNPETGRPRIVLVGSPSDELRISMVDGNYTYSVK